MFSASVTLDQLNEICRKYPTVDRQVAAVLLWKYTNTAEQFFYYFSRKSVAEQRQERLGEMVSC